MAESLKAHPEMKVKIVGHTDNVGKSESNLKLSQDRAESVKRYLVERFAADAFQLSAEGKGAAEPIADNAPPEGRARNRRVEFIRLGTDS